MEVTYNLPVTEWYVNTSRNDLQYWGLDYPPLTAYHSWLCGALANKINPLWVELFTSRGHESPEHKIFMRGTVLCAELIYIPAVFAYFLYASYTQGKEQKVLAATCSLLYPGLILIDHGHFQYNNVSLGFALWAILLLGKGWDVLGSVFFCLSLNYKQMELYHALPFFCYLFGACVKLPIGKCILKFLCLSMTVLVTFPLCWFPFLWNKDVLFQVIHRIFPFARGVFEDKVSNFWCSITVVIRLKEIFVDNVPQLAAITLGTTLLALVPSSLHLVIKTSFHNFKLALLNSALVFFLFSFQVHEKSILLAALPACLLLEVEPFVCLWFLLSTTFSMFPLFHKEALVLPCFVTQALFLLVVCTVYRGEIPGKLTGKLRVPILLVFIISMTGFIALCLCSVFREPPQRYPDLWPRLVSLYSFGHFALFTMYFHYQQLWNSEDRLPKHRPPPPERKSRKAKAKKEL
ncbi:dolichyl pyrophosphate Man9GlcNAc2 alpha-1,3-glucosyltransferase-like isoform X2 [Lineus longissimus]